MLSADIGKNYRYCHRYRPISKTHKSVVIGIGRYGKTMIVRPLVSLLIQAAETTGGFYDDFDRLIMNF